MRDSLTGLDRAIESVAARMTAIDAAPDVRARVIARLRPRSRAAAWQWMIAPVAAAAAVIIATILWPRHESSRDVVNSGRAAGGHAALAAAAPASSEPAVTTPARRKSAPAKILAVPGLPVLARPDALTLDAIQPASLTIPQLQVAPIVTERLKMPAVDANGSGR